jgi:hypothetical protein
MSVNADGRVQVIGRTASIDFPAVNPIDGVPAGGPTFGSSDEGLRWSSIGRGLPGVVSDVIVDPSSRILFAATDAGVYALPPDQDTWEERSDGLQVGYAKWSQWAIATARISKLARNPSEPFTLYATSERGTFKTTDAGQHWARVLGVSSDGIAVDASRSRIYVGGYSRAWRSDDGGSTWRGLDAAPGNYISDIAVDSTGTIYVAFLSGIARSTDSGTSWERLTRETIAFARLAIDPTNSQTLYAAGPRGVLKSSDAGRSWRFVLDANAVSLAIAANGTVYAGTTPFDSAADPAACLYRSTNGGVTWQPPAIPVRSTCTARAIRVDPTMSTKVYAALGAASLPFLSELSSAGALTFSTVLPPLSNLSVTTDGASRTYLAATAGKYRINILKIGPGPLRKK